MRSITLLIFAAAAIAQQPGVVVISHRGEHLHHLENTISAYRAAFEAGADFIETDVRTTADGKLVIMHDGGVDRLTVGHGEIAAMTLDQIRRLEFREDRGARVPTFEEVLEFARGKIGVYIDAKRVSASDLVAAVRRAGMEDRVVVYSGLELARGVQKLDPRIRIMPEAVSLEAVSRLVEELRPKVIAFDGRDFRDGVIAVARRAQADIFVDRLGFADNPESWADAIRRGATGIQTDHPAELVTFLRAKGLHR